MKSISLIKILKLSVLCFVFLFFMSCEKEKDECADCNSAISHMAGKIAQNVCNPSYMQDAWNKLKEDCGTYRGNLAAGYMAENCAVGYNGSLHCTKLATGLQFYDDGLRWFRINYQNALPGDSLLVIASYSENFAGKVELNITANQTIAMEYNGPSDFNWPVYFTVINTITQDTVANGMNNFNYNRPNNWGLMREVRINYNPTLQGYTLAFEYWM